MMTYMGIIEQRINEILQANSYINQQKQFDSNDNTNVKFQKVNFGGFLSPNASAAVTAKQGQKGGHFSLDDDGNEDDDDDDEDDDEKPMGIEEFKARVMNGKSGKM